MKEENEDVGATGIRGKNHLGMMFDEAGQFPDLMKHYNALAPKLGAMIGTIDGKESEFTWKMISGLDTYDEKKYERRRLNIDGQ